MEYASKAVGTAGLSLGIIGTSLGALAGAGGLAGLLGVRPGPGGDPGDRPVTRYEMAMQHEIASKDSKIALLEANTYNDTMLTNLEYYKGEVYTLRALAYSELIKLFCEAYDPATAKEAKGVVLRKSYSQAEEAVRASLYDSYQFVLNDLSKAEELLSSDYDMYSSDYATKALAEALHARVALYMQDWDTAIEYSTKMIEDNAFSLSTAATYTTGVSPITNQQKAYTYVDYMWTNDLATEIIWMVDYTITSYGGALGQVFLNFNNDYVYYYPDYVPSQWVLDLYKAGDARYSAYFTTLQTGYAHGLSWPLLTKYFGNEKFIADIIYHVSQPKPLRLAEQYLIRAEAYCRKDQYSLASADIMNLRKARYTSGASASLNKENWLQTISEERVKELYMEGFRLHDLKRWNMGFTRKPQTSTQSEGSSLDIKAGNPLFVWPIPQNEIEAPGSGIKGNESNR